MTQQQKFHTDDITQCLHNKYGSHGDGRSSSRNVPSGEEQGVRRNGCFRRLCPSEGFDSFHIEI